MKQTGLVVIIAFFALLGSSCPAGASLAIYSYSGTTTTIGGGKSISTSHTGTLVIDLDTMSANYIGQFSIGSGRTLKNYWISTPLSDAINTQVLGPNGASSTVLAIVQNPGSRYTGSVLHFESAIGLNSRLTIRNKGTTETAILPRTLSSPSFVITEDSTYDYIAQSSGTYTFNSTATLAYNNANKTISTAISELENSYKAKNFIKWSASNLVGGPTLSPSPNTQPLVTTLAGSGIQGYADGQGISASFNEPLGIAVDNNSNIIVSDSKNHLIRKITPTGVVSTIAGSGIQGYQNGMAFEAKFSYPQFIATDKQDNIYVTVNTFNPSIRKISLQGTVTTLAGGGPQGFADGNGFGASFWGLAGLGLDNSGNLYVADAGNQRIRKISSTGVVTTLAGAETNGFADGASAGAFFSGPCGIAVDLSGNIIVADSGNHRIRKITPTGVVTTIAGGGLSGWGNGSFADGVGTSARFNYPSGLAIDNKGNIYVSDTLNNRIRKISSSGVVSTIAGNGNAGFFDGTGEFASFNRPNGIAIDSTGNVYVADSGNNKIRKITISQ